jgi:hypothetical protein
LTALIALLENYLPGLVAVHFTVGFKRMYNLIFVHGFRTLIGVYQTIMLSKKFFTVATEVREQKRLLAAYLISIGVKLACNHAWSIIDYSYYLRYIFLVFMICVYDNYLCYRTIIRLKRTFERRYGGLLK